MTSDETDRKAECMFRPTVHDVKSSALIADGSHDRMFAFHMPRFLKPEIALCALKHVW